MLHLICFIQNISKHSHWFVFALGKEFISVDNYLRIGNKFVRLFGFRKSNQIEIFNSSIIHDFNHKHKISNLIISLYKN